MSAKGDQVIAAIEVVAWRIIDADGSPATDWIDGDGRGREPFVAGGSVQLAYSHAEGVRVPNGWVLVPRELTPEMAAAAAAAVWPTASEADCMKATEAALILLKTRMDAAPGATLESIAAGMATMFPAYAAFLAAAPSQLEAATAAPHEVQH